MADEFVPAKEDPVLDTAPVVETSVAQSPAQKAFIDETRELFEKMEGKKEPEEVKPAEEPPPKQDTGFIPDFSKATPGDFKKRIDWLYALLSTAFRQTQQRRFWRSEQRVHCGAWAGGLADCGRYPAPFQPCQPPRVVGVDISSEAIDHGFALFLECPEHPVPDDQPVPVILVDVLWVGAMMNAVVRGRVEDPFQRTQLWDQPRVPDHAPQRQDNACNGQD